VTRGVTTVTFTYVVAMTTTTAVAATAVTRRPSRIPPAA
jgi:hypothetical protein